LTARDLFEGLHAIFDFPEIYSNRPNFRGHSMMGPSSWRLRGGRENSEVIEWQKALEVKKILFGRSVDFFPCAVEMEG
jgi:hypothetical protein